MIWIGLIILAILLIVVLVFSRLLGNWRMTLNNVITSYVAWKQLQPAYSDKEIFLAVLDGRYPKVESGLREKLYKSKEEIKERATNEIESGISVIDKFNLPNLIYICLLIENNSIVHSNKYECIEDFIKEIEEEVKRQGFEKYI